MQNSGFEFFRIHFNWKNLFWRIRGACLYCFFFVLLWRRDLGNFSLSWMVVVDKEGGKYFPFVSDFWFVSNEKCYFWCGYSSPLNHCHAGPKRKSSRSLRWLSWSCRTFFAHQNRRSATWSGLIRSGPFNYIIEACNSWLDRWPGDGVGNILQGVRYGEPKSRRSQEVFSYLDARITMKQPSWTPHGESNQCLEVAGELGNNVAHFTPSRRRWKADLFSPSSSSSSNWTEFDSKLFSGWEGGGRRRTSGGGGAVGV